MSPAERDAIFATLAEQINAGDVEPVWDDELLEFHYCTPEYAARLCS
jgi:hypothetical protein